MAGDNEVFQVTDERIMSPADGLFLGNYTGDMILGPGGRRMMHGRGRIVYDPENDKRPVMYEGNFVRQKREGTGRLELKTGETYEGGWRKDVKHGLGRTTYVQPEGEYTGHYLNDAKDGEGKETFRDSKPPYCYEGGFKEDCFHGKGVMRLLSDDSVCSKGTWAKNERDGINCYRMWPCGHCYAGQWKAGRMHGKGTLALVDGTVFSGAFKSCCPVDGIRVDQQGVVCRVVYKEPVGAMRNRKADDIDGKLPPPIHEPEQHGIFLNWQAKAPPRQWKGEYVLEDDRVFSAEFVNWVFPKGLCKLTAGYGVEQEFMAQGDMTVCEVLDAMELAAKGENSGSGTPKTETKAVGPVIYVDGDDQGQSSPAAGGAAAEDGAQRPGPAAGPRGAEAGSSQDAHAAPAPRPFLGLLNDVEPVSRDAVPAAQSSQASAQGGHHAPSAPESAGGDAHGAGGGDGEQAEGGGGDGDVGGMGDGADTESDVESASASCRDAGGAEGLELSVLEPCEIADANAGVGPSDVAIQRGAGQIHESAGQEVASGEGEGGGGVRDAQVLGGEVHEGMNNGSFSSGAANGLEGRAETQDTAPGAPSDGQQGPFIVALIMAGTPEGGGGHVSRESQSAGDALGSQNLANSAGSVTDGACPSEAAAADGVGDGGGAKESAAPVSTAVATLPSDSNPGEGAASAAVAAGNSQRCGAQDSGLEATADASGDHSDEGGASVGKLEEVSDSVQGGTNASETPAANAALLAAATAEGRDAAEQRRGDEPMGHPTDCPASEGSTRGESSVEEGGSVPGSHQQLPSASSSSVSGLVLGAAPGDAAPAVETDSVRSPIESEARQRAASRSGSRGTPEASGGRQGGILASAAEGGARDLSSRDSGKKRKKEVSSECFIRNERGAKTARREARGGLGGSSSGAGPSSSRKRAASEDIQMGRSDVGPSRAGEVERMLSVSRMESPGNHERGGEACAHEAERQRGGSEVDLMEVVSMDSSSHSHSPRSESSGLGDAPVDDARDARLQGLAGGGAKERTEDLGPRYWKMQHVLKWLDGLRAERLTEEFAEDMREVFEKQMVNGRVLLELTKCKHFLQMIEHHNKSPGATKQIYAPYGHVVALVEAVSSLRGKASSAAGRYNDPLSAPSVSTARSGRPSSPPLAQDAGLYENQKVWAFYKAEGVWYRAVVTKRLDDGAKYKITWDDSDPNDRIKTADQLRVMLDSEDFDGMRRLYNDISEWGQKESRPIPVYGPEGAKPSDFVYVSQNRWSERPEDYMPTFLGSKDKVLGKRPSACECRGERGCLDPSARCFECACVSKEISLAEGEKLERILTGDGRLTHWALNRPSLVLTECGSNCPCGASSCRSRVVSNSGLGPSTTVLYPVFVMHVSEKAGFGLFNGGQRIFKGSPVIEYVGEIRTEKAGKQFPGAYAFELVYQEKQVSKCKKNCFIDAGKIGGVARFMLHSGDPNLVPVYVLTSTLEARIEGENGVSYGIPRVVFFAQRDIEPSEQLTFSYSDGPCIGFSSEPCPRGGACPCGTAECPRECHCYLCLKRRGEGALVSRIKARAASIVEALR